MDKYGNYISSNNEFVEVYWDFDPCNPRREYDQAGHFYTWLRSYISPDEDTPDLEVLCDDFGVDYWDEPNPLLALVKAINESGGVALPVSAYEHSGIAYSVGSPTQFPDWQWDAGYAGIIFVDKDEFHKEWGRFSYESDDAAREAATSYLTGCVETYDQWARGEVQGYAAYSIDGSETDSCWGFFGGDPDENGIANELGELTETSLDLDEWLEEVRNDPENMLGTTALSADYAA